MASIRSFGPIWLSAKKLPQILLFFSDILKKLGDPAFPPSNIRVCSYLSITYDFSHFHNPLFPRVSVGGDFAVCDLSDGLYFVGVGVFAAEIFGFGVCRK